MIGIKLIDLVVKEYIAIVGSIENKVPATNGRIVISSNAFYKFLDANLYIKRKEKLDIYKALNLIICNSNGITSVTYDRETKKTTRKIVINYTAYVVLKKLAATEFI